MATPSVFITGAAAGIGRATALRFAEGGYHVGAYDVDTAGLETLSQEIQAGGGTVRSGILDVSNADQWRSAVEEFHADQGSLNVLINNAGILSSGKFADIPLARQRAIVDVNVTGTINGLHTAFPYLRDTPGAVAVNLCSASAIYGQPELATYGATKSAVRGLSEALDLEWTAHDIRVIAIWPLFVKTAMTDDMDIASVRRLGIHLTADGVAAGIWKAVHDKPIVHKVHYEVGLPATLFANAAKVSPNWALRAVNRFMTR